VLDAVKDIAGCEADGVTPDELYSATYAHGKALAEGLFLGDPPAGPLGQTLRQTKASIQSSIQGFVSKASNIETQIGLRKVAMDASDARIVKIANLLQDPAGFGASVNVATDSNGKKPTISSASMPATSPFLVEQGQYLPNRGLNARASATLSKINAALGASSISDYEAKRGVIIGYALDALAGSASALQRGTEATDPALMIAIQTSTVAANQTADDASSAFLAIKAQWKAYGETIHACSVTTTPWYCK
jgi:hypothetical protein